MPGRFARPGHPVAECVNLPAFERNPGLFDVQADAWPPNVATSFTRPFTRTRAPLVGVRPSCDTTVISPVPSSTL